MKNPQHPETVNKIDPLAITVRDPNGKIVGGGEVTPGGDVSVARITVDDRQRAENLRQARKPCRVCLVRSGGADGDHARGAGLRQLTTFHIYDRKRPEENPSSCKKARRRKLEIQIMVKE